MQMFRAIQDERDLIDLMFGLAAGVTTPDEFFSPENVGAIMSAARARPD